jgi:hypothetical protein
MVKKYNKFFIPSALGQLAGGAFLRLDNSGSASIKYYSCFDLAPRNGRKVSRKAGLGLRKFGLRNYGLREGRRD